MRKIDCPNFNSCDSPLCFLDETSVKSGIWYPGEGICRRRDAPDWVRKQKAIAKTKAPSDKYFTVEMLEAIKQVRKGIGGINPDQPLRQAKEAEGKWIVEKKEGRVIAKKNQKPHRVVAKKRETLVGASITSKRKNKEVSYV